MHDGSAGTATYEDPLISVGDATLTIRRDRIPTGAKHIRLKATTGVEEYRMTRMTGNWRIWGSGAALAAAGIPLSTRASRGAGRRP